ncbi:hypothetical protein CH333_01425 [candidate division WOR-3 bacterium JGI_Cruoil_03_44_89]|uniref:Uncharacterized protein n=1 Tax=candidate division WOR-3 bacterium JGI_Cruoil_03_44_89 TaxID=1973748 RepID=A0A235BY64_UNCW3|nr:MAG: hypothetical protein CH333_01425 [candidate division WOR-3 bacterium JGI_Cruoil_03_44_89]
MKRQIPLAIAFICGIGMIIQFFIPHPVSRQTYEEVLHWQIIVGIFMMVIAVRSLCVVHIDKIRRKREGWGYSFVTLFALAFTAFVGIGFGRGENPLFSNLYEYIMVPMMSTMFSLLAFYMASAAYRAFKARTAQATLLLVVALIVMFGRVPVGERVVPWLPRFIEWILMYPNMAAQRGILLGVGLGMIATSLKIILGIERGYLGGG